MQDAGSTATRTGGAAGLTYYPLGTVVLLQGAKRKLMIFGRKQINAQTKRVYDYIGCLYPEGLVDPNKLYLFDHDRVSEVVSLGYVNDAEIGFQEKLRTYDLLCEQQERQLAQRDRGDPGDSA